MIRVVGCDPGTSSLDLLLLVDGRVEDQARLTPRALRTEPELLAATLRRWGPLDLIAGPSGYGLPLVHSREFTPQHLELMSLVHPNDRGHDQGVIGFRSWVRGLVESELHVVFLPGGIHLPTIPPHRKANTIDMGTADKLAVAALALSTETNEAGRSFQDATFGLVEIGSAFSAVLVVDRGKLVAAAAGTRGPIGLKSAGAWDGEVAYALNPLVKGDLFRGGLSDLGVIGRDAFRESLVAHVAGLQAVMPFDRVWISGSGLIQTELLATVVEALGPLATTIPLPSLPGAWVKHAAQGAALLADGLAGGRHADLVESLELRAASGTIWDHIRIRGDALDPWTTHQGEGG